MLLAEHVDEVVVTEEFFTEGVAHKVEGVGPYVVEDFEGEVGVVDVEDEFAEDVVGGEAQGGGFGEVGLVGPEVCWV